MLVGAPRSSGPRGTVAGPLPTRASVRWTGLIGVGIAAALSRRTRALSDSGRWRRDSGVIQRRQLRCLLRRAARTVFGRGHDFGRLAELPDRDLLGAYRKAVPVADWYAYRALIARMREGAEPDVLWPGLVRDFAQTSGTTAGDKYIPVSREMLRSNYRCSLDIFAHAARFGVSLAGVFAGRIVFLGGSTELATSEKGIRTGDLSGIVTPLIRWPITAVYSPGRTIALMSHWPTKLEAMARATVDQDVRMITGMPSWALVLFEKVLEVARAGGRRAECIRDVWPNLRLFVHGGVKYAPFEPLVRRFWSGAPDGDDIPTRLELYPASEAFVAIQDTRGEAGLRLCADRGNFFEFVPLDRIGDPEPPALACDEVEPGRKYVVVLSTCAGLWRYILGDVVEFDTVPDGGGRPGTGPARLRIVGRHRHFINAFGENLIVEHIENAVAAAARATGVVVGEFTAAPVYPAEGRRAGLELAVELVEPRPSAGLLTGFRDAFDAELKRQSVDYGVKRSDNLGMAPPTVTALTAGAIHRWMDSRGKLGGQHKCPRCANHRDIMDAIVGMARPE